MYTYPLNYCTVNPKFGSWIRIATNLERNKKIVNMLCARGQMQVLCTEGLFFMFCWPCISIYSFKEKPTWSTIYLQHISSNTSTCFRRIYSPSSGGTPCKYNSWYLLFSLDDCLLSWLGWNPARTTSFGFLGCEDVLQDKQFLMFQRIA
jgi:hypothetical protein